MIIILKTNIIKVQDADSFQTLETIYFRPHSHAKDHSIMFFFNIHCKYTLSGQIMWTPRPRPYLGLSQTVATKFKAHCCLEWL